MVNKRWTSTPGYIYCSLLEYFKHFLYIFIGFFRNREKVEKEVLQLIEDKYLSESNKDIKAEQDQYCGFVTYSNRCLWDTYISYLREKKGENLNVCLTAFLHTGYNRVLKWTECNEYVIDFNQDFTLPEIDEDRLKKCDVVLITHCFGSPFIDFTKLINLALKHNIPIYEDCVQIGFMGASPFIGSQHSTIRSWSGGQDKIPVSFGGGIGFVKGRQLRDELNEYIKRYPMDTVWGRYKHLCVKFPIILMYHNTCSLTSSFFQWIVSGIMQQSLYETTWFIRRNWGGFVHDRMKYSKQCTTAQLLSIKHALTKSYHDEYQRECHKRQHLVKMCKKYLGDKQTLFHFPWMNACDYEKSSNFYYHFRVKDRENTLDMLSENTLPSLPCQAWFVNQEQAPRSFAMKEEMLIVSTGYGLEDDQIEMFVKLFVNHLDGKKANKVRNGKKKKGKHVQNGKKRR